MAAIDLTRAGRLPAFSGVCMSVVIKPTVGRKVWYRPSKHDQTGPVPMVVAGNQPLDATVIAVWGDRMVNLLVTDTMGKQFPVLSCTLVQPGDVVPEHGRYCEWMPFQVATAPNPDPEAAADTQDAS